MQSCVRDYKCDLNVDQYMLKNRWHFFIAYFLYVKENPQ